MALNIKCDIYKLSAFALHFFHFAPADISVYVIDQKRRKANRNADIAWVIYACHYPQNNQHNVIGGISQRKQRTSSEGKINGNKAGCNGHGTRYYISGVKMLQNKIKNYRYGCRSKAHKHGFFFAHCVDLNLRFIALVRVFQPRYQRKNSHRHSHTKVSNHLAVIRKAVRNYSVQQAEHHH